MHQDIADRKLSRFFFLVKLLTQSSVDLGLRYSVRIKHLPVSVAVRAGSVVLLVGVGSLVCWRLYSQWRTGEEEDDEDEEEGDSSPYTSPIKSSLKKSNLLASLLEEELFQEAEGVEEDDPAFIQQLIDLLKETLIEKGLGRYFGPDSPGYQEHLNQLQAQRRLERNLLLGTPPSGGSSGFTTAVTSGTSSPTDKPYLADRSLSGSSRDRGGAESDEELLEARAVARCRRRRKRIDRNSLRLSGSSLHDDSTVTRDILQQRQGLADRGLNGSTGHLLRLNSSQERERRKVKFFTNADSDDEASSDAMRDDSEGLWGGPSFSDLMEKMRYRHSMRSLSREPSVASNLSESLLNSPSSFRRFPFRREDSVCSNLSDMAMSECSELSMDFSVKEEVNNTFRRYEEIEHNLDELKSSVLQMDEEVAMFVTKPDPYSLKITFSDYSLSSKDDPDSLGALDEGRASSLGPNGRRADPRKRLETISTSGEEESAESIKEGDKRVIRSSDTEAEVSLEWDSPRHGWSSMQANEKSSPVLVQRKEEGIISLEWDDGGVKQYPEVARPLRRDDSTHNFHDNTVIGGQLLPNHSFLELDLEAELLGGSSATPSLLDEDCRTVPNTFDNLISLSSDKPPSNPLMTESTDSAIVTSMNASALSMSTSSNDNCQQFTGAMTGSTDSAIYSAPGSRSATASPLPIAFSMANQSSSGLDILRGFGSDKDSPSGHEDTESHWRKFDRPLERALSTESVNSESRVGRGPEKRSAPRWSSEESGFAEADCDGMQMCLSPVHELREKDSSESTCSSPRLTSTSLSNLQEECNRCSNQGLNLIINDNLNCLNNPKAIVDKISRYSSDNLNEIDNFETAETNQSSNFVTNLNLSDDSVNGNNMGAKSSSELSQTQANNEKNARVSSSSSIRQVLTIGEKVDLLEYSLREWQGNTAKASTIRKGYSMIESEVGLSKLRTIRGDQYCAVRATVFQALLSGHPLPRCAPALARLNAEVAGGSSWVNGWTFAHRLSYKSVLEGMRDCMEALDQVSDDLVGSNNKESALVSLLNSHPDLDVQLCEAVKLHMLVSAIQLFSASRCGGDIPLFAMIMFARQSSENPASLMENHLNCVGETGGLEQIEMFLLGHSLQATLQVVRPSSYGQEDFVCYYPDTSIGVWPQLALIAEDDRHYNVILH